MYFFGFDAVWYAETETQCSGNWSDSINVFDW